VSFIIFSSPGFPFFSPRGRVQPSGVDRLLQAGTGAAVSLGKGTNRAGLGVRSPAAPSLLPLLLGLPAQGSQLCAAGRGVALSPGTAAQGPSVAALPPRPAPRVTPCHTPRAETAASAP